MLRQLVIGIAAVGLLVLAGGASAEAQCYRGGHRGHHYGGYPAYRSVHHYGGPSYYYGHSRHQYSSYRGYHGYPRHGYYGGRGGVSFSIGF